MYTVPFPQGPNMYAIIESAGHQMKVTPGGLATLAGTAGEPGAEVTLDHVLLVEKDGGEVLAGAPYVANARVIAVVDGESQDQKFACSRRSAARACAGPRVTARSSRRCASKTSFCRLQADRFQRMAHKKGQGSSRNGRDSNSQRLGVKAHDGNVVSGGTIIVRQRGRRFRPGLNAGLGKDDTIFAKVQGRVKFEDHGARGRIISILPLD